ncbi:hypothetical protein [Lentibacillus salinarum]|uniref:Uncharacterized protein n=1 Tax=Lentibacillus salinarum TaxID=446820 RepID=A0ABW3ZX72_9BACI
MEIIFIILAIVAALSGFFKDNAQNNRDTSERRQNKPVPAPFPSGGEDKTADSPHRETETVPTDVAESIEERQYEQRKQLAERMNKTEQTQTPDSEHDGIKQHITREPGNELTAEQQKMKRQMNHNLTRTGLVNGVIMSEVLGQPRAIKPYRSIVAQRKK